MEGGWCLFWGVWCYRQAGMNANNPTSVRQAGDDQPHQRHDFYRQALAECREKGQKPGAAAYRYTERYGEWPPYEWTRAEVEKCPTCGQQVHKKATAERGGADDEREAPPLGDEDLGWI